MFSRNYLQREMANMAHVKLMALPLRLQDQIVSALATG